MNQVLVESLRGVVVVEYYVEDVPVDYFGCIAVVEYQGGKRYCGKSRRSLFCGIFSWKTLFWII